MCKRMQQHQNSENRAGPAPHQANNSFLIRDGGWEWGGDGELLFNGYRLYVEDDEKVLGTDSSDGYATL